MMKMEMQADFQTLDMHQLDAVQGGFQWLRDAWNNTRDAVQRGYETVRDTVREHGPRVIDTLTPDSVSVGPFSWDIPDPFGTGGYNRR